MEFRIEVTPATDPADGWQVRAIDVATGAGLADPTTAGAVPQRTVRRVAVQRRRLEFVLPMPASSAVASLAADAPHRELCTDAEKTLDAFEAIVQRSAGADTKRFGRYLFEVLIGDAAWKAMIARAAGQPMELSLSWSADEYVLNRFPWEMMHSGGSWFLAQEGKVAIVRRCPEALQGIGALSSPPKVLFVVGTHLQDTDIQPGAEYLRLLQGLRDAGLQVSLRTRLLLRATVDSLQAAVREFAPDVVHVICHGNYDADRRPFLQLVDPENPSRPAAIYAGPLVDALRAGMPGGPLPSVVVLSACHTADQDLRSVGQMSAPFAAAMVHGGVPIAVGMGGRVMDQACRLFTRRFYEALLSKGDIAHAAAEGRRAAIRGGKTDPETSVDWTMPTMFLAGGVAGTTLNISRRTLDQQWHAVASAFRPEVFPAFCDRLEIVERFDLLLAGQETQMAVRQGQDLQTLCIAALCSDGEQKYGRTWLLRELARKAMRDGHVACVVDMNEVKQSRDWPRTCRALLQWIAMAVDTTAAHFRTHGVPLPEPFCTNLRTIAAVPAGGTLPLDVAVRLGGPNPDEPRVQAAALRLDLMAFLTAVRALRPQPERQQTRLVLLIDDLHRTSPEVARGLETLLGPLGLRQARQDIRVVLMYSSQADDGQQVTIDAIAPLTNLSWSHRVELDKFRRPTEERDAYQYFLLNWLENGSVLPLTVAAEPAVSEGVNAFYTLLSQKVNGIPSNLGPQARDVVDMFLVLSRSNDRFRILVEAKDDAFLQDALKFQRDVVV